MSFEEQVPGTQYGAHNDLHVEGALNPAFAQTLLHLSDGRSIAVPTQLLVAQSASPKLLTAEDQVFSGPRATGTVVQHGSVAPGTIALVSEHLEVGKRTVETAKVRLHRGTETFTDTVNLDLMRIGWDVQRVAVGQVVEERPEMREEGDVTIFPMVEERLVTRREYFLLEEVRVRRVATTTEHSESVELKRDTLTVERSDLAPVGVGRGTDSSL